MVSWTRNDPNLRVKKYKAFKQSLSIWKILFTLTQNGQETIWCNPFLQYFLWIFAAFRLQWLLVYSAECLLCFTCIETTALTQLRASESLSAISRLKLLTLRVILSSQSCLVSGSQAAHLLNWGHLLGPMCWPQIQDIHTTNRNLDS